MAFQPCPAWKITVKGTSGGPPFWNNIFHVGAAFGGAALTQAAADTIAANMRGFYANLAPTMSTNWSLAFVTVTDLRTEGAPEFNGVFGAALVGTGSGDELPSNVAGLVQWRTAFRGREGRGRTYLVGFTETAAQGENMSNTAFATLVTFAGAIGGAGFCVLSRFKGTEPATTGARRLKPIPRLEGVTHTITSGSARQRFATQRRRIR